jgi:hypothetical protein
VARQIDVLTQLHVARNRIKSATATLNELLRTEQPALAGKIRYRLAVALEAVQLAIQRYGQEKGSFEKKEPEK